MEDSLNSSSESGVIGSKSVFKKPANFYEAFEVSVEDSVTVTNNKSDLDTTSSGSQKFVPFKKSRKSIQQSFVINADDSALNSDAEQSVSFTKPPQIFNKNNQSAGNVFDVSYNETNTTLQQSEVLNKTTDESNIVISKINPFKKSNEIPKDLNVENETSLPVSENTETSPRDKSTGDGYEADSTTFVTKENPFKKSKRRNDTPSPLQISVSGDIQSSQEKTTSNSRLSDGADSSSMKTKVNPFLKRNSDKPLTFSDKISFNKSKDSPMTSNQSINRTLRSFNRTLEKSVVSNQSLEESQISNQSPEKFRISLRSAERSKLSNRSIEKLRMSNSSLTNSSKSLRSSKKSVSKSKSLNKTRDSNKSLEKSSVFEKSLEKSVFSNTKPNSKNVSIDRSVSKFSNNASYLEQSSINDENLNDWMSDHSDEEIPLPRIPSVATNLSHTKEKPPVNSPTAETNPVSIWEKKLSEIMSNAERKSQAIKHHLLPDTPPKKPKISKKQTENSEKVPVDRYKPDKLARPAPFATKKLYEFIVKKFGSRYGIDTMLEAENMVLSICDVVKKVTRRKSYQKKLIVNLKKEMAKSGLIETTMDFYEFVIKFLPYSFRVRVVPCLQPVTNQVFPPREVENPFDKIL